MESCEMAKKKHGGIRDGSGRTMAHPEGSTMAITVRVPEVLVQKLDSLAEKREISRSQAVTEAIREVLKTQ